MGMIRAARHHLASGERFLVGRNTFAKSGRILLEATSPFNDRNTLKMSISRNFGEVVSRAGLPMATAFLCLGLATAPARAGLVFVTPDGSTTTGPVSAKVDFTVNNGSIEVVLTNLTQNPVDVPKLLSAIEFTATGASGSGELATVNSALITNVSAGGAYTAGVADPLTRWKATGTGTTIALTTLSGGNPDRLIIGPDSLGNFNPALGGLFSNANAGVIGDNPLALGSATFTVTTPGVTTSSVIDNVVFQFGTTAGSNQVRGVQPFPPTSVPEPATVYGASLAVFLAVFCSWRRRKAC